MRRRQRRVAAPPPWRWNIRSGLWKSGARPFATLQGSLRPHAGQVKTRCAGGKPYSMRGSYPHTHTATLHQFLSNCPACRNYARRRPTARVQACAHHGRGATSRRVASSSTCRYISILQPSHHAARYLKRRRRCSVRRPPLQF